MTTSLAALAACSTDYSHKIISRPSCLSDELSDMLDCSCNIQRSLHQQISLQSLHRQHLEDILHQWTPYYALPIVETVQDNT